MSSDISDDITRKLWTPEPQIFAIASNSRCRPFLQLSRIVIFWNNFEAKFKIFKILHFLFPWQRQPFWIILAPHSWRDTYTSISWCLYTFLSKKSNFNKNPPFFVTMATVKKFVQPIPILLHKFIRLDARNNPTKFEKDCISSCWENTNLTFQNFFIKFRFPWQREPFWKFWTLYAQLDISI